MNREDYLLKTAEKLKRALEDDKRSGALKSTDRIQCKRDLSVERSGTGGWYVALGKLGSQQIELWYDRWLDGKHFDFWIGFEASKGHKRTRLAKLAPGMSVSLPDADVVYAPFEHRKLRPPKELLRDPVWEDYQNAFFLGQYDVDQSLSVARAITFLLSMAPALGLTDEQARNLSVSALRKRALSARKKPARIRQNNVVVFVRDAAVKEYVKRLAKGRCDLCRQSAPFKTLDKIPFLECHHIIWLADDGDDSVDNTVALCPNCHRKMHLVRNKVDVERLSLLAKSRVNS